MKVQIQLYLSAIALIGLIALITGMVVRMGHLTRKASWSKSVEQLLKYLCSALCIAFLLIVLLQWLSGLVGIHSWQFILSRTLFSSHERIAFICGPCHTLMNLVQAVSGVTAIVLEIGIIASMIVWSERPSGKALLLMIFMALYTPVSNMAYLMLF